MPELKYNITVVGGLGRVGLPLSVELANRGHNIEIVDIDGVRIEMFKNDRADFEENNLDDELKAAKDSGNLKLTKEINNEVVILSTNRDDIKELMNELDIDDKIVLVRQTVSPETIRDLQDLCYKLAYIPERLAQGKGMKEIKELPQITGVPYKNDDIESDKIFNLVANIFYWTECIMLNYEEAELSKLYCNFYRYGTFALANDMYLAAEEVDANFNDIRRAIMKGYPRMKGFPKAGFAGGYCLPKDAKLFSDYSELADEVYHLNQKEIIYYLFDEIEKGVKKGDDVGLLGITSKPNNDDTRDSLKSLLLPKLWEEDILSEVEIYDPYILEKSTSISRVMSCDKIIIGVPHDEFKDLEFAERQDIIDMWGVING